MFQGTAELLEGPSQLVSSKKQPPQVHEGKVSRLIPLGALGERKPGLCVGQLPCRDQIRANVVVGVAEGRIDLDSPVALADRVLDATRVGVGPGKPRVGLGGRTKGDGLAVELDGSGVSLATMLTAPRHPEGERVASAGAALYMAMTSHVR